MMANNRGTMFYKLAIRYPGLIANMISPDGWADPWPLPFALDNGAYTYYKKGIPFDKTKFALMLSRVRTWKNYYLRDYKPLFLVVPDVVGEAQLTINNWQSLAPILGKEFKLALAIQDGMDERVIEKLDIKPHAIFIGGTLKWKLEQIESKKWNMVSGWLHAGRIYSRDHLELCKDCGVDSIDSTAFFREGSNPVNNKTLASLIEFLERHPNPRQGIFDGFL